MKFTTVGGGIALFGLFMGSGCAIRGLPASDATPCPECATTVCADRQTLTIDYLGSGGYVLRRGDDVVLLGPFISNPGLLSALSIRRIEPNVAALERWLPDVADARAIIVGHAHYDHLLDVPWIARERAPGALIYGSPTVAHLLAGVPELEGRVHAIDATYSEVGAAVRSENGSQTSGEPWVSIPNTRVRFLPIESEHARHLPGLRFYGGVLDSDLEALPARARGWVGGRTLAFLIEFLHPTEDRALFTLHYQDAASGPSNGFPPPRRAAIDAALVCVASHRRVDDYPERLLERARPRHVVLGHWEDFLAPHTRDVQTVRGVALSDPRDFIARVERYVAGVEGSSWILPVPGAGLRLVACPDDASSTR